MSLAVSRMFTSSSTRSTAGFPSVSREYNSFASGMGTFPRHLDMERRSFADYGFHVNGSLVPLNNFLDHRQPQPRPATLRRKKRSKNLVQVLLRDPTAGVRDDDLHHPFVVIPRGHWRGTHTAVWIPPQRPGGVTICHVDRKSTRVNS